MNKKSWLIMSSLLLLVTFIYIKFNDLPSKNKSIDPDSKLKQKLYPFEDHFLMKQYPNNPIDLAHYERSMHEAIRFSQSSGNRTKGAWITEGPGNLGARINTIAVNPSNNNHILVGYSCGGIYLTTNGGDSWISVFDNQTFLSIGDIVFDPLDHNVVYAGTGDPNVSGYPFIGNGFYKSENGGLTWKYLGLKDTRIISQIRVSRQNNKIIYVGSMGIPFYPDDNRGLYKSTDGGNSWNKILYINDSTGVADIVLHPFNDNIVYATTWTRLRSNRISIVSSTESAIYRSKDGGASWEKLENGLPTDENSRIGIDISPSNPNVLYACIADAKNFNLKGIYSSSNGGDTWTSLDIEDNPVAQNYGGFGWYFGKIRINPVNHQDVFLLGVDLYRTLDGGKSWELAAPEWWTYDVHSDKHDLIFAGNQVFLTTDGGAYRSSITNLDWYDIENIPTTQFYRVAHNPHNPDYVYGGAQDNGTTGGNQNTKDVWERLFGGDGFQAIFHPTNPEIYYYETQNGSIYATKNGGNNFENITSSLPRWEPRNWDTPYIMSLANPDVLYTGTNKIYKNITGTEAKWTEISSDLTDPASNFLRHNISCIAQSPIDSQILAVGTSDAKVWITPNDGTTWIDITEGLPDRYVSHVHFSSLGNLYVSFTGYRDNDNSPYLFTSDDLGKNWKIIQSNLPKISINNIITAPGIDRKDEYVFVATDAGVFYTEDGAQSWKSLGDNMPNIPVYDLKLDPINLRIIAGTFGKSIMTFDLKQINYGVSKTQDNLPSKNLIHVQNPAPAYQQLIIHNGTGKTMMIDIFDIQGRRWLSTNLSIDKNIIDACLPKGFYILRPKDELIKPIKFSVI